MTITERPTDDRALRGVDRELAAPPSLGATRGDDRGGSLPGRTLLAAASAGAGAVHIAMVPAHAAEWLPEGLAFAATGWLQIGLGAVLLARPSRRALQLAVIGNALVVAAWAVTRTRGMPFGPEAGLQSSASFIDIVATGLEALVVLGAVAVLARPRLGAGMGRSARAAFLAIPLGLLALSTAAIASPSAADHQHGGSAAAGHADGTADHHDTAAAGDGHAHDVAPADDKGLGLIMNGGGEGGGHLHAASNKPLDPATQAELDRQLDRTKALIVKYPTIKEAEAAGFFRSGPYTPGLGTHYTLTKVDLNIDGAMDPENLDQPVLIYDGVEPDAKIAGFMYLAQTGSTPPEGFAGPNDAWHNHTDVCVVVRPGGGFEAPLGSDVSTTQEMCDRYGGKIMANTGFMVHVWSVPGYESKEGVFSNVNSRMACPNGEYHIVPQAEYGHRRSVCRDVPPDY